MSSDLLQKTAAELTAEYDSTLSQIRGEEHAPFRNWQMRRDHRERLIDHAVMLSLELARRGIRPPGSPDPDHDVLADIRHVEGLVATGDRVFWNRTVHSRLLELLAYRRLVRRQELTRDDEDREVAKFFPNPAHADETWVNGFCIGLRRGFELRGEVRKEM